MKVRSAANVPISKSEEGALMEGWSYTVMLQSIDIMQVLEASSLSL